MRFAVDYSTIIFWLYSFFEQFLKIFRSTPAVTSTSSEEEAKDTERVQDITDDGKCLSASNVDVKEPSTTIHENSDEEEMSAPQRTPISLLQDLCMQNSVTADYKLMSVEGAYHAPTFMYRVQVGETVATSTGASKKKAKHAAALAILEKLLSKEGGYFEGFDSDGVKITASNLHTIMSDPGTTAVTEEEDGQKNPVGELQEQCIKNRWQPPFYETKEESGLPHEKIFTMSCSVGTISEIGTGKSKRLAKREAAKKMLDKIREMDKGNNKETATEKVNNVAQNCVEAAYPDNVSENRNSSQNVLNGSDNTLALEKQEDSLEKTCSDIAENAHITNEKEKAENGKSVSEIGVDNLESDPFQFGNIKNSLAEDDKEDILF